jgi:hypothetical protein
MADNADMLNIRFDQIRNDELMNWSRQPEKLDEANKLELAKELRKRGLWMPNYLEEIAPKPESADSIDQPNLLTSAWKGTAPLWKVWWLLGIPMNIFLNIFEKLILKIEAAQGSSTVLWVVYVVVALVFGVAWVRMAWICAPNVQKKVWTPIARSLIVFGGIAAFAIGWMGG